MPAGSVWLPSGTSSGAKVKVGTDGTVVLEQAETVTIAQATSSLSGFMRCSMRVKVMQASLCERYRTKGSEKDGWKPRGEHKGAEAAWDAFIAKFPGVQANRRGAVVVLRFCRWRFRGGCGGICG